ncbi:7TM diverse intracellular signaling domain-containing protein [Clostridiisalibacter paucivorans]|uniref:7TM diverse intracellular signaling domain-containing protein n=1 Tax=Clostridiisalibacter paucivorans TaxID=408753 RepID=UPI00068488DC|nr:7TM diverse intracellular signaling domain-containing protein [Clostridiisalibacter paucivorans]
MANINLKKVFLILMIVLVSFLKIKEIEKKSSYLYNVEFEYYEDTSGNMDFEEVREKFKLDKAITNKGNLFSFGKSASTYWIRIPLDKIDSSIYKEYISIYNPTVTEVRLYMPVLKENVSEYREFSSGWYFGENREDEDFFYPVFKLDGNIDFDRDIYIKVYSDFTQNYKITFLSEDEFNQAEKNNLMIHGILFGILLAVAIQNIIIYMELRDRSSLYFGIYIIFMFLYQGNLLGVYNFFFPKYTRWIMANTITISLMAMIAMVLFFREFFRIKNFFPIYNKMLKVLFLLILLGFIFLIGNQTVLANLYAHSISNIGSIFMMFVAFKAYNKGFRQAKLFILGWLFILISLGISFLRHYGVIPNNVMTINITFIAVAIQAVLLSTALVQMVKSLTKEKENALLLYKDAEKEAESNEMAFLHAQIKPHFLYNALNVIVILCRIDPEKARELLLDLSGFLRHTFDFKKECNLVYLKDELEYVQTYVNIEQARFRDKLNVIYELDEIIDLKIPPLILQPLVENAIIHGIRKRNGVGKIILRVKKEDDNFRIEVEDDGLGMTEEEIDKVIHDDIDKGKGVGLTNINKRLHRFYGEGLTIKSSPNKGTKISMIIRRKSKNYN